MGYYCVDFSEDYNGIAMYMVHNILAKIRGIRSANVSDIYLTETMGQRIFE